MPPRTRTRTRAAGSNLQGTGQPLDAFGINGIEHLAIALQGRAHDETVRQRQVVTDVFEGDTAAQENLCGRTGGADALDIGAVGRQAGAGAGDDERVGQAALNGVAGGILDGPVAERDGMFDVDIGKDLRLRANLPAVAQGVDRRCLR